jgi:hypothetical protein
MAKVESRVGWGFEPLFIYDISGDRCLQTCMAMVIWSSRKLVTDDYINQATLYEPGKNSQNSLATVALKKILQRNVRLYTRLDFARYAREGAVYLEAAYSSEWLEHQRQFSSPGFQKEQRAAQVLVKVGAWEQSDLAPDLIDTLLRSNHILIVSIDAGQLYELKQPSAHSVLVYGVARNKYVYHDPWYENGHGIKVPKDIFAAAVRTHIIAIPNQ